jgi:uncharacterized protein YecT (DUF1311 family)
MRRLVPLCAVLAALTAAPVFADELDGWCAQVEKASSIVICSDAGLRQHVSSRNKLFDAAREKLSPEAYKALTEDQSRWIKSYTARCGVPVDGSVPSLPIASSIIDCYRREAIARTAYLSARLSEPNTATTPLPTTSAGPLDQFEDKKVVAPTAPMPATPPTLTAPATQGDKALDDWKKCLDDAAIALADQPEPARTVADAALGSCGDYESAFSAGMLKTGGLTWAGFENIKTIATQRVISRVMLIRAALAKMRKDAPSPAMDYNRM